MRGLLLVSALLAPSLAFAGPQTEVERANRLARVEPRREAYANAAQVFVFSHAALYQIYAAPGQVTDLALEAGEELVGEGALAAGDTARWIIGETRSGAGAEQQVHILLKPTAAGLATNLVINTNRRTYHLELKSTDRVYLAAARWRYPAEEAQARIADRPAAAEPQPAQAPASQTPLLNFSYRIDGRAPWRPVRVYDDGRRTIIEFSQAVTRNDLPPVFLRRPDGELELTNFRVIGSRMIIDRLIDMAELRLQQGRRQQSVRITRTGEGT